jgi:hypothetical protein
MGMTENIMPDRATRSLSSETMTYIIKRRLIRMLIIGNIAVSDCTECVTCYCKRTKSSEPRMRRWAPKEETDPSVAWDVGSLYPYYQPLTNTQGHKFRGTPHPVWGIGKEKDALLLFHDLAPGETKLSRSEACSESR